MPYEINGIQTFEKNSSKKKNTKLLREWYCLKNHQPGLKKKERERGAGSGGERDYLRLKPLFNLFEIGTELRKLIGHSLRPVSDVAEESDNGNE